MYSTYSFWAFFSLIRIFRIGAPIRTKEKKSDINTDKKIDPKHSFLVRYNVTDWSKVRPFSKIKPALS